MSHILVVGLNPAWQRIVELTSLRPGEVNRARASRTLASGKGMNAAKALRRMGHEISLLQILAGENGKRCLEACGKSGIRSLHVIAEGETRVCVTLLEDGGQATEIIEPFRVAPPETAGKLLESLDPVFPDSHDAVLICGAIPEGLPDSVYLDLLNRVRAPLVIWDSATGLLPGLPRKIGWIKVNAGEYAVLRPVFGNGPHPPALITDGPKPARVSHSRGADGLYPVPELAGIKNPIGAGDAVTAALADGLLRKMGEEKAVRHALAVGAAACLSPLPAEWEANKAGELEAMIRREAA